MARNKIAYVDGPRLARGLFAASDWVWGRREEINRINVFPVPDGDTGTNFSLTLRAVADACRALGDAPLPDTVQAMSRGAVLGAFLVALFEVVAGRLFTASVADALLYVALLLALLLKPEGLFGEAAGRRA